MSDLINTLYDRSFLIDRNKIDRNRWLFIEEGLRRGYNIEKIHPTKLIIQVEKLGKGFIYNVSPGSMTAITLFIYINNKIFQKRIMKKSGIAVAETFSVIKKISELKNVKCKFPCVVKPVVGSLSKNVFTNIKNEEQLVRAVSENLRNKNSVVLIEEMVIGREYRLLTVNGKFISCVEKVPAYIIGDGMHTAKELINIRNSELERGDYDSRTHTVHKIKIDKSVEERLQAVGVSLGDVIDKDCTIIIGTNVLVLYGGDFIDKTNEIHSSFIKKSESFAQKHNLFIIGFDVIAQDIMKEADSQKYIFNELNKQPFFDVNEKCNIGKGTPVASIMWDEIEKSDIMTDKFLIF